jgi:hypothetical protein
MPIHFNLVGAGMVVTGLFVGMMSKPGTEAILKAAGLTLRTHDLSWGLCLPAATACLLLDVAWRFVRRRKVPVAPLWHPHAGGHVFIVPVWFVGFVTIAAWAVFAYVDSATH